MDYSKQWTWPARWSEMPNRLIILSLLIKILMNFSAANIVICGFVAGEFGRHMHLERLVTGFEIHRFRTIVSLTFLMNCHFMHLSTQLECPCILSIVILKISSKWYRLLN